MQQTPILDKPLKQIIFARDDESFSGSSDYIIHYDDSKLITSSPDLEKYERQRAVKQEELEALQIELHELDTTIAEMDSQLFELKYDYELNDAPAELKAQLEAKKSELKKLLSKRTDIKERLDIKSRILDKLQVDGNTERKAVKVKNLIAKSNEFQDIRNRWHDRANEFLEYTAELFAFYTSYRMNYIQTVKDGGAFSFSILNEATELNKVLDTIRLATRLYFRVPETPEDYEEDIR